MRAQGRCLPYYKDCLLHENSDRYRCLGAAGERRGAHAEDDHTPSAGDGPRGGHSFAAGFPLHAVSDLSGDFAGADDAAEGGAAHRRHRSGLPAHRHRRTAWLAGARRGAAAWLAVHHGLSQPFSGVCACALQAADAHQLCGAAPFPQCRPRHAGADAGDCGGSEGARLQPGAPVVARRESGGVQARGREAAAHARGAGIPVCGPAGGGEAGAQVPRTGPARREVGGRHRSGRRQIEGALSPRRAGSACSAARIWPRSTARPT